MAVMRKLCATRMAVIAIMPPMMHTERTDTRTLTIVLPEADWQALRQAEPDAVGWLQARIRERLAPPVPSLEPSPVDWSVYDEY
jgi:hypothetical protein